MPNIRILYDNDADDATVTASTTASADQAASNLLTDVKGDIHRSTGTTCVYTFTWTALMMLNLFKFVFTNYSSTATMKIDGYTNAGDVVPLVTVGPSLCCGYTELENLDFGGMLGANAWSYCGGAYAGLYFDAMLVRQIKVTVTDVDNGDGWLDTSRAVTGNYLELESNPAWNPALAIKRGGELHDTQDGTTRAERKPMKRSMALDLQWINSVADRTFIYNLFAGNGSGTPAFFSLFPENADDLLLEQQHEIYGRIGLENKLSHPQYGRFSAPLEVREI